jgi:predicted aminopeptidase
MLILGVLSVLMQGCYVLHLAGGQLHLINDQKPIPQAIREERDPGRKALLAEVETIKQFAHDVLGFSPDDSYAGYYAVEQGYLTLVLSAAPRDKLEPLTRWYPFAGRVPYRTYFDEQRARRAQEELEREGYDTFLHPSAAYSTLGFFRDPVTTPMLDRAPPCPPPSTASSTVDGCKLAGLAETLLHELTHRHAYAPGHTDFNEQLASFVGRKAALQYLIWRGLYTPELRARLELAYRRQRSFEELVAQASKELRAIYASHGSLEQKLKRREPVFAQLAVQASAIFPGSTPEKFRMNNARILQYGRYDRNSQDMQALWERARGNWPRFWALVQVKIGRL